MKNSGNIRIIAGRWRSRIIPVCTLPGLRPTGDRMRETLFNWLQANIHGAICVDAFAGSGALGLEALSRGASQVCFIEKHKTAAKHLKRQLQQLQAQQAEVICADATSHIAKMAERSIDILFLDPPFAQPHLLNEVMATISPKLANHALIYVEQNKQQNTPPPKQWTLLKDKTSGNVHYQLWQFAVIDTL